MVNKLIDEKDKSSKNTMFTLKDILEIELRNREYDEIKKLTQFSEIREMLEKIE